MYLPGALPVRGNLTQRQPEQARCLLLPVHARQTVGYRAQQLLRQEIHWVR